MSARVATLLAVLLLLPGTATADHPSVPNPTVTGPIPNSVGIYGHPTHDSSFSLEPYGYVEEEYFVSGNARTFTGEPRTADYTTRIIVRRPVKEKDFNGTVIVEWLNVTAQFEQPPDWYWSHPMILREGFAYVLISAQAAGHCCAPLTLKVMDPVRYRSLSHPGDDFSFDILSQTVQALEHPTDVDAMGGLDVDRVLAAGHSQSASRLFTYVTAVHQHAGLIDGFYLDAGGSKTWPAPPPVPVIQVFEEFGFSPTRPNISHNYRLWEVAGAAHADYWVLRHAFDAGDRTLIPQQPQYGEGWEEAEHEVAGNYGYDVEPRQATCAYGGNMFPKRYAVDAALYRLDQWVRSGVPPPQPPAAEFEDGQIARDEHGNALGGLRLPPIDVPVSTYIGNSCGLFGNSFPLDPVTLRELYPTHQDYVKEMRAATRDAVSAGILLPEDARDLMDRAKASTIPLTGVQSPLPPHLTDSPT
ncbi:MAG: alpha/beta hydrolase domain-containing protein [Actinomycetota bacterium]